MKLNNYRFLLKIICLSTLYSVYIDAKKHGPAPGRLIRMDLAAHRRIRDNEREYKESSSNAQDAYKIGVLGDKKKELSFNDNDIAEEKQVQSFNSKDQLFKAALEEIENYPIQNLSDKFYLVTTDFCDPFSDGRQTTSDTEWKIEIRILEENKQPKLQVKAFSRIKNNNKNKQNKKSNSSINEKEFAQKIHNNIMTRYYNLLRR